MNLIELHMSQSLLMAETLTKLIVKAQKLRIIKLKEISIQGNNEDISACELAIVAHPALKEFNMDKCMPASKNPTRIK